MGGRAEIRPSPRPIASFSSRKIASDEIGLVWRYEQLDKLSDTPMIVVMEKNLKEFLAFSSTYISTASPITAFFRVLTSEQLDTILNVQSELHLSSNPITADALVGVVMAEAYLQVGDWSKSLDSLSIQSCLATISGSVASGIIKGYDQEGVESIIRNWSRARKLINDEPLRMSPDLVGEFWVDALLARSDSTSRRKRPGRFHALLADLHYSLSMEGQFHPAIWRELASDIPDIRDAPLKMQGAREERIRTFDRYAEILRASEHIDLRLREFAAGALLTMVSDGSFDYMPLCQVFEKAMPKAVLWYGLLASLKKGNDVLTTGHCLGRRVSRLLSTEADIFSAPIDDVSVAELEVLSGSGKRELSVRTAHQSVISVEITPGVSARYKLQKTNARSGNDVGNASRTLDDIRELRYLIDRAGRMIDRLDISQPDLFEKPYGKRPYSRGPKVRIDEN